jgi:hypothetical protein
MLPVLLPRAMCSSRVVAVAIAGKLSVSNMNLQKANVDFFLLNVCYKDNFALMNSLRSAFDSRLLIILVCKSRVRFRVAAQREAAVVHAPSSPLHVSRFFIIQGKYLSDMESM